MNIAECEKIKKSQSASTQAVGGRTLEHFVSLIKNISTIKNQKSGICLENIIV